MQKDTKVLIDDHYLVTVVTTQGVYRFRNGLEYMEFIEGINPLEVIVEEWEAKEAGVFRVQAKSSS